MCVEWRYETKLYYETKREIFFMCEEEEEEEEVVESSRSNTIARKWLYLLGTKGMFKTQR